MKKAVIRMLQKLFSDKAKRICANRFRKYWFKNKEQYVANRDFNSNPRLLFLPVPVINNKYLATALKKAGYKADTLMTEYYSINNKNDFDLYFDELKENFKSSWKFKLAYYFGAYEDYLNYALFDYCVKNYDIFNMPFTGGVLSYTPLKNEEAQILHWLGCKTVTLAYGSDYFQYSKISDPAYRHAIISNYPERGRKEYEVNSNYIYWAEHTDFLMGMMATDGLGRWDMLPVNYLSIDTSLWELSKKNSKADGINGIVKITHSPNHRFVKGTEFIIDAVNKLKAQNVLVELVLIEKKTNEEVRSILQNESDIHIEQLVFNGYALSAIEGMACGLPVITNEESEIFTRGLRRYSFLNECPVVSASPENILSVLKVLIRNPELRMEIGKAGRKYVEKYHSETTTKNIFEKMIGNIWFNKKEDLMSYFHPLNPASYNNQSPKVDHPLFENRISNELLEKLNR